MTRIAIPRQLQRNLGPEMKMDVHWVDVKLHDGRCMANLVVRGCAYITGHESDPDDNGSLSFNTEDIANLRRRAFLGAAWPFWPKSG